MSILEKIAISILWFLATPILVIIPAVFPQVGLAVFWALLAIPVVMIVLTWFNRPKWFYSKFININKRA